MLRGKCLSTAAALALALVGCVGRTTAPISSARRASTPRSEGAVRVLKPFLDGRWLTGASLAFVDQRGTDFVNLGKLEQSSSRGPDENTLYEIGSLTKTFTSLLLFTMVDDHRVALEQSVQSLLPGDVHLPASTGRDITLLDLSEHRSGLPRDASNMPHGDLRNPYADFTAPLLYEFLSRYESKSTPGNARAYSNLGAGVLGHVLARVDGRTYGDALRARVCGPLGLTDTTVELSAEQKRRLAPPQDADLAPTESWSLGALEGAGALHSTTRDLARYAQALMDTIDTPIRSSLREQLRKRQGDGKAPVVAGWSFDGETLSHSGLTGGDAALIRIDLRRHAAVALLTNAALNVGVDALGRALLTVAEGGIPGVPSLPREVLLGPATLDERSGSYTMAPGATLEVSRDSRHLVVTAPGELPLLLYPSGGDTFFARRLELEAHFERSEHDGLTMVVREDGAEQRFPRTGAPHAP